MAVIVDELNSDKADLDRLLEGYQEGRLTNGDMLRLISLLVSIREDAKKPNRDKMAAAIMLRVIEQERSDAGQN